jgi:Transposase, Mutator family
VRVATPKQREIDARGYCPVISLSFPEPHRRRIRTTNGPERFNQELKRRTRVVRIFPNQEACLRLMTALADLTLYTAWDASDITQMDYKWTIL